GLLEDKEFLSRLLDSRFDVALHEIYDCYPVAIFELIGVTKTVAVSAFGMTPYAYEITGIPANPSYVPGVYSTYSDDMTFWERLNNFKFETEMDIRNRYWERELWSHFDEVYPGFPDFRYLLKQKVGAVLLNVHEFTETPRPTVNMVRYIGGLTVHAAKPLDEKLDAILNKRSTNVLLSFGSLSQAKDMPLFLKKDIVNAFAAFPNTTFIWKYEEENDSHLFEDHPNIHIMKWVPQRDLLGDKRLSAFITHAGMNSVLEATFAGKPMITVPLFGDQYLNAKNVERRGLALLIDRSSLNKDTLIAGLAEVLLPNASYARRAATVARYLNGRPAAARAEVSHWVKLIAEEGQMDHLMMKARDLSFVQYHCLDIIAYLLLQFVVIMYIAFLILKLIIRQIGVVFRKRKVD
ncbi:UDP-glucoronosyl and UDP-glucosyl transferase, partial [Trichostrongylus colubriformis]